MRLSLTIDIYYVAISCRRGEILRPLVCIVQRKIIDHVGEALLFLVSDVVRTFSAHHFLVLAYVALNIRHFLAIQYLINDPQVF